MFCWGLPIDTKGIIEDADTTISFWMIELIALILEDGGLGEDGEAVGKTLRDEELTMIGVFYKGILISKILISLYFANGTYRGAYATVGCRGLIVTCSIDDELAITSISVRMEMSLLGCS